MNVNYAGRSNKPKTQVSKKKDMDFDVIVLGSGPAGYVAAIKAAQLGLKTACIEKDPTFGGTCLNVGCIPSKALLKSSRLYHEITHDAQNHGIEIGDIGLSFSTMMERKQKVIQKFTKGIDFLFKKNKVTGIQGLGKFVDPHTITTGEKTYTAKNIIIATGSYPASLPFLKIDEKHIISSTGALALSKVPKKLIVVGAGVIGLELGSVYRRLGSQVTCVEYFDRPLPEFDRDISKAFEKILKKQGFTFHFGAKVTTGTKNSVTFTDSKDLQQTIEGDAILVSIGRRPYTENLGLENINVSLDQRGFLPIDDQFRLPGHSHIFAIGDVACPPMLAHKGSKEGEIVAEFIAGQKPHPMNYHSVPNVVYTHPEIACVGITEQKAKDLNLSIKVGKFPFAANSRQGTVSNDPDGFVKVIVDRTTDRLLGMHIIGPAASDLIMEGVITIENSQTYHALLHSNHAHPTFSEAVHEAILALTPQGPLHI